MKVEEQTLCFLIDSDYVWLGQKTRKIGKGKWNGFGGKRERNESLLQANSREVLTEVGSLILAQRYHGCLTICSLEQETDVYVFTSDLWVGRPQDSDEIVNVQPFPSSQIPYDNMIKHDRLWLPHVLAGSYVRAVVDVRGSTPKYRIETKPGEPL